MGRSDLCRPMPQALGAEVQFEQAFNGLLLDNTVLDAPRPRPMPNWHNCTAPMQRRSWRRCRHPCRCARVEQWLTGALDGSVRTAPRRRASSGWGAGVCAPVAGGGPVLRRPGRWRAPCAGVPGGGQRRRAVCAHRAAPGVFGGQCLQPGVSPLDGLRPGDWQQQGLRLPQAAPPAGR